MGRDGVIHIAGGLNNRHDPIKLGRVTEDSPVVAKLTVARNVDIDDNNRVSTRRGRVLRYTGTPHSMFSHPEDDSQAWFIEGETLYQLNTDWTATMVASLNTDHRASFDSFNGVVVFTNTDQIGFIVDGQLVEFSQELIDDNEALMPAGQYLCFDHNDGCLLVARGSEIFKSKPWNPMVYDKRYGHFPMNGAVHMLCTVEDGWWVGTEKNVSFVSRADDDKFNFQHVNDMVAIDGAFQKGYDFIEGQSFMYVVWASVDGFVVGRAGGRYESLSYPDVVLPSGSHGKVFIANANGIEQYIASIFNPEYKDNYNDPALRKKSANI